MSNYTQNVSYGPKDALATGDAAKRIKGVEIDAEFAEIATAISSKEDTANKGAASGYCGLDGSGLIDVSDLPATAALTTAVNTFTAGQKITAAAAYLDFIETGVTANNTTWRWLADGENFYGYAMADDLGSGSQFMAVTRTGTTVDSVALGATAIALNGAVTMTTGSIGGYNILTTADATSASLLTSGTIPDARIQASGVTQHQASLSIAETQIADGAVFPRIGAAETISGAWTFSALGACTVTGNLTRSTKGVHPYFSSATQNSGIISIGTAAASGTPGAGDIYIQYTA